MRSIWKGSIGFGLVSIPVKLYSAIESSSLDFDMLDGRDHARIRYMRVNEHTHKEVPYDKIVKGYKLNDDYVIVDEHDFEILGCKIGFNFVTITSNTFSSILNISIKLLFKDI